MNVGAVFKLVFNKHTVKNTDISVLYSHYSYNIIVTFSFFLLPLGVKLMCVPFFTRAEKIKLCYFNCVEI